MVGKVRPSFELRVTTEEAPLLSRIGRALKSRSCPVSGLVASGRIELHVKSAEQHLWSPQLVVDIHQEDEVLLLRGRFGPHPSVWTLYLAAYVACAFLALLGVSFAYAQYVMETAPWALLSLPVASVCALCLYLFALLGQGLSHEQMDELKLFLESHLPASKEASQD